MTTDQLIDGIIAREGGFVSSSADRGGATCYGVTAATLGGWRHLNRQATVAEVRALKPEEARAIYKAQYCAPFACVPFDHLQATLIDFGVTSGVTTAIKALQGVLDVPVDGILGERTRTAIAVLPWRLVNAGVIAARMRLFTELVEKDSTQREFYFGWCRRAVSFMV